MMSPGLAFILSFIGAALLWWAINYVSNYIDRVFGYASKRATNKNPKTNPPTNSNTLNTVSQDCQ